ncbi:MAG: biotin/lipoyl-binding protein [Verrucomicrobiota bacterium]|nr:biotin/lipoyl-binding protein [Verrucomicrobiota bacterium]
MSVIFFLLCIWAIKDGWFPSDKVMKKHPYTIPITFNQDGFIKQINVKENDVINDKQVIAVLDKNEAEAIFHWEKGGTVIDVYKTVYDSVNKNETIALVKPNDTFYIFNKTLTIVSGVASIGFLIVHKLTI